jgi:hypothetical protein
MRADPVSLVSHQIRANCTAELPIKETVWPEAMIRKLRFQYAFCV